MDQPDSSSVASPQVPAGFSAYRQRSKVGFAEDFRRFFMRGLAALLPTLITVWLLVWVWDFLWDKIGQHIVYLIEVIWLQLIARGWVPYKPAAYIAHRLDHDDMSTRLLGVTLAVLMIYIVGVFVGNLLGRTMWRLAEHAMMKVPLLGGVYPAVKQVTDFVLSEKTDQFQSSKVVAVEPHAKGIWSIGLVTGSGLRPLNDATGQEMLTVFVPSSPTAFSGYVLVVPKSSVVELPLQVEDAMRLLVSGGVIAPGPLGMSPLAAGQTGAINISPLAPAAERPAELPPQRHPEISPLISSPPLSARQQQSA